MTLGRTAGSLSPFAAVAGMVTAVTNAFLLFGYVQGTVAATTGRRAGFLAAAALAAAAAAWPAGGAGVRVGEYGPWLVLAAWRLPEALALAWLTERTRSVVAPMVASFLLASLAATATGIFSLFGKWPFLFAAVVLFLVTVELLIAERRRAARAVGGFFVFAAKPARADSIIDGALLTAALAGIYVVAPGHFANATAALYLVAGGRGALGGRRRPVVARPRAGERPKRPNGKRRDRKPTPMIPEEADDFLAAVAAHYLKLRARGTMLSPADLEQLAAWEKAGVPASAAARGISAAFRRGGEIRSLAQCRWAVEAEVARLKTSGPGEEPAEPAREVLAAKLDALASALEKAAGRAEAGGENAVADAMKEAAAQVRLGAKAAGGVGFNAIRSRVSEIETAMLATIVTEMSPEAKAELDVAAAAELVGHDMTPEERVRALRDIFLDKLRERFNVPSSSFKPWTQKTA